jgi:hypothetical protein
MKAQPMPPPLTPQRMVVGSSVGLAGSRRQYERQYIMIAKTDPNYLHLAEVKVMGH